MSQHSQCGCGNKEAPCGCCAGIEAVTPLSVENRPGLSALAYRTGTHASFLESMLARLSTLEVEHDGETFRPLRALTTREAEDPSIAFLDAWAVVADVLTFYQERLANEGYLRTATERRSILELARLIGYRLRPGAAASVFLALTLEDPQTVVIDPFGVRAQSVPGPGELPQTFENIEKLDARSVWNKLGPRLSQPQNAKTIDTNAGTPDGAALHLKGASTGLNQNDPLLIVIAGVPNLFRIVELKEDSAKDTTRVVLKPWVAITTTQKQLTRIIGGFEDAGPGRAALTALAAEVRSGKSDVELADLIESETLPSLGRVAARKNISAAVRSRVSALAQNLGEAATAIRAIASKGTVISSANLQSKGAAASDDELAAVMRGPDTEAGKSGGLTKAASVPPANLLRLKRDSASTFALRSDLGIQALGVFQPELRESLPVALANATVTEKSTLEVYAFRVKASPFGQSAQPRSEISESGDPKKTTVVFSEWTKVDVELAEDLEDFVPPEGNDRFANVIYLDSSHDKIIPDSFVVVDTSAVDKKNLSDVKAAHPPLLIAQAQEVQANIARTAYGFSGQSTRIVLGIPTKEPQDAAWIRIIGNTPILAAAPRVDDFQVIRRTVVYAQAEALALAEEPIEDAICTDETNHGWIVLDGVYSELTSGRWVIVSGERADIIDGAGNTVPGIQSSELAMLAEVVHDFDTELPGDSVHTRIRLAQNLEFCYARDKITINANVLKATHGESRTEVLGSGDGTATLQQFTLRQPPLTFVSAPTPAGVESTLKVFVNDVEWHEAESIFGLRSTDRSFVTTRNDQEVTTAIFGNGKQGATLPTGTENIRAEYRQGIGKSGNVAAGQITLLTLRPLGVKEVNNPLRASGGADPETRDQARKNAPLAVRALDRLVSTEDYSDFARTFGGVGKAFAERLSDGRRELVHVTIAGAGDAPIDESSDLFRNLLLALSQFGDPAVPIRLAVRELRLLVITARVRLLADYVWEKVAPKIRATLLDRFSFENRELGQDVFLSEVISAMQSVPGVSFVDVDALGGLAEKNEDGTVRTPNELIEEAQLIVQQGKPDQRVIVNLPELPKSGDGAIRPAQLAYLAPEVPDTLILNLIENNGN
ncbi:MAG TPA: putative baseplate assembly protein [Blastocatellia bacterium]|nr:putative baseplate assembly protein [Blastocatellia bacterium]